MKKRMAFIPELQEQLKRRTPAPPAVVEEALKRWHADEKPRNPLEAACFGVFEKVQEDIEGLGTD